MTQLNPFLHQHTVFTKFNGIARTLKRLCTSKGDYWIKQWFSSIASFFKMGTSLKGKDLLPQGANSFLLEQFLMAWKITFTQLGDVPWMLLFLLSTFLSYANEIYIFFCFDALRPSQQFFQSCQGDFLSSLVKPVLSSGKCLAQGLNTVPPLVMSLKLATLGSSLN